MEPDTDALRHGAYICLRATAGSRPTLAEAAVPSLAARLGFENEFNTAAGHPCDAIAFLRRVNAATADLEDDALLHAEAIVHVASASAARVQAFCDELLLLIGHAVLTRILDGVVQPTRYTSNAMHEFAYAHQLAQQPARGMPNAFLLPMRKTPAWWAKDWMERHTYFLPRYDDAGRMTHQGHALAAAAGIPALMRRTYKHPEPPAPADAYEFINYFECADAGVATFYEVCAALRDRTKNPEWDFVLEGPTWQGLRVERWPGLFA
jgi:hypothetical protein